MQTWDPIRKTPDDRRHANLADYRLVQQSFSWADARRRYLGGLPGGGLNIAYEAVDRHLDTDRRDKVALRCLGRHGEVAELTYAGLARQSCRFANVLRTLGVHRGERVFLLLNRGAELYVAALGTLRFGAVLSPLFPAFGPEPIRERLERGDAVVLVTTPELYERRVAPIRDRLPGLRHVLVTGDDTPPPRTESLAAGLAHADESFPPAPTGDEDLALLHFTSGTTGRPKGAMHVHGAVLAHYVTAHFALDLRPDDVFWCTADPGWVTGTSYGIIAPLVHGLTLIVDAGDFDAKRWYRTLEKEHVSVW